MTSTHQTDAKKSMNWLALSVSILSLAATFLALSGYGVALSAEDYFGIPHATLFNSSLDLLSLGTWTVLYIFENLGDPVLYKIWTTSLWITGPVFIFSLILWADAHFNAAILKNWYASQVEKNFSKIRNSNPEKKILLFAIGLMILLPIAMGCILAVLLYISAALTLPSIIGMTAGKAHITNWVITPTHCLPVLNREARMQPAPDGPVKKLKYANCVKISEAGDQPFYGRVIFSTYNAIFLYEPNTGESRRISTDKATISVIAEIPPPIISAK